MLCQTLVTAGSITTLLWLLLEMRTIGWQLVAFKCALIDVGSIDTFLFVDWDAQVGGWLCAGARIP